MPFSSKLGNQHKSFYSRQAFPCIRDRGRMSYTRLLNLEFEANLSFDNTTLRIMYLFHDYRLISEELLSNGRQEQVRNGCKLFQEVIKKLSSILHLLIILATLDRIQKYDIDFLFRNGRHIESRISFAQAFSKEEKIIKSSPNLESPQMIMTTDEIGYKIFSSIKLWFGNLYIYFLCQLSLFTCSFSITNLLFL